MTAAAAAAGEGCRAFAVAMLGYAVQPAGRAREWRWWREGRGSIDGNGAGALEGGSRQRQRSSGRLVVVFVVVAWRSCLCGLLRE